MRTRFAMLFVCLMSVCSVGCGRINWARLNSDMTDQQISEQASKRLQPGMTVDEVQDRAVWFTFHRSAKLGMRTLHVEPDWESRETACGFLADSWSGGFQRERSSASATVECMTWRLEESGFVWEFMVRPSEENLYAVFGDDGRLGALFRTEMNVDVVNSSTDVPRRIPLTPEPVP